MPARPQRSRPGGQNGRRGTVTMNLPTEDAVVSDNRPTPWLLPLITRLHFYIGVFVGPFLLIAALSGIVYALTPQLEDWIYRKALYTDTNGPSLSLDAQVASARTAIGPEAQDRKSTRLNSSH